MRIFFGRRNFDVLEIFVEGIAGIVELLDEFRLIRFRVDVEGSSENDHLYLVGFMTG